MKPALEGILLFADPGRHGPVGRAEAAGPDPRQLHRDLWLLRVLPANSSASPIPSSDFCGAD